MGEGHSYGAIETEISCSDETSSSSSGGGDNCAGCGDDSQKEQNGRFSALYTTEDGGEGGANNPYNANADTRTRTPTSTGKASLHQTVINMVKMCCGTGILALPFATSGAGLVWHPVGLIIITLWNIYSTDCLLKSHDYMTQYYDYYRRSGRIQRTEEGEYVEQKNLKMGQKLTTHAQESLLSSYSSGCSDNDDLSVLDEYYFDNDMDRNIHSSTNTFGKIAYFAFGEFGLNIMDGLIFTLMLGIIICYEDAMVGFVGTTPFTSGNKYSDACVMLLVLIPLASLSDFSIISKVSAMGTLLILTVFIIIGMYGISENGFEGFNEISEQKLMPNGIAGFSSWYGVVSFSYGTIPFTFNMKESMDNPKQMMKAAKISLWSVMACYFVIGELMLIIFWPSVHGIDSDITTILPQNTFISYFISLLMTMIVLFSTPLIIVPTGDLLMKKLGLDRIQPTRYSLFTTERSIGVTVRISLCVACTIISLLVPNFVYVISFVGCLCVSIISYTYPPLAHMQSFMKLSKISSIGKTEKKLGRMLIDSLALMVGLLSSILTTSMTFKVMLEKTNIMN